MLIQPVVLIPTLLELRMTTKMTIHYLSFSSEYTSETQLRLLLANDYFMNKTIIEISWNKSSIIQHPKVI